MKAIGKYENAKVRRQGGGQRDRAKMTCVSVWTIYDVLAALNRKKISWIVSRLSSVEGGNLSG